MHLILASYYSDCQKKTQQTTRLIKEKEKEIERDEREKKMMRRRGRAIRRSCWRKRMKEEVKKEADVREEDETKSL